jgi:hypothetical protein
MAKSLEKVITQLKKPFREGKKSVIKKLYGLIEPTYQKYFPGQFAPGSKACLIDSAHILAAFPELQELDRRLNYFLLHASFGDKWFILSLLPAHFEKYPTSRVIAGTKDKELIERFVGETCLRERFIFIDEATLYRVSFYHVRNLGAISKDNSSIWIYYENSVRISNRIYHFWLYYVLPRYRSLWFFKKFCS